MQTLGKLAGCAAACALALAPLGPLAGGNVAVAQGEPGFGWSVPDAPVVTIRSQYGMLHIVNAGGEAGGGSGGAAVRIASGPRGASLSRFAVNRATDGRVNLPMAERRLFAGARWRTFRLPARQFNVPNLRDGGSGIAITNPGGDMTVEVPQHVSALFISAGQGAVDVSRVRGPYVIQADGDVTLTNVGGHGFIRSLGGTVDLTRVAGAVHVETATGDVVCRACFAERAEVIARGGGIEWDFLRVGRGAYRFATESGDVRLALRPGISALVDAQSETGAVSSEFAADAADVRFSSDHALSLALGGGGPQISVTTRSGSISIAPLAPGAAPLPASR